MPEKNTFSSKYTDIPALNFGTAPWKFHFDKPIRLAIYVLESSNSRRLTYFMPPLVS
jgi:hypothetical protein